MNSRLISAVHNKIQKEEALLNSVSRQIWENPELKYEETHAHDLLTKVLREQEFSVHSQYILPTAFRAEYCVNSKGPTVAVICEYDALPKIGHACGHNLIAEAGLGAGLAIKAALETNPEIAGKVVVLGTPAEEGGGGKIELIKAGAFKDIDIALMVHPSPDDHLFPPFIAIGEVTITYTGKEAHASGYPWEGRNALDAAVACYNNISLLRQHIKPTCKVHGIIINGGVAPNIIPGLTESKYCFRAASRRDLEELKKRIDACSTSAATATGCDVSSVYNTSNCYDYLITNKTLAGLYKRYAEEMGVLFQDGNPKIIPFMASSDMGNVSHVVPSIHPTYFIGTKAANHSVGFAEASGAPEAQFPTLIAAKSMALVGLEIICNPDLLKTAKQQLEEDLAADAI